MAKKLYLHIGTHKTGSTSIQQWLKLHNGLLVARGYYYPMEGSYFYPPEASSSLLAHALLENYPKYIGNTILDLEGFVCDIRRDIQRSQCDNVIISSEHFSHAKQLDEVKKIFDVFSGLFESITVIVYIRRQDYLLESTWSQLVKYGDITSSFSEYLEKHLENPDWNYFDWIAPWIRVFSNGNIRIRCFEQKQFFGNSLIIDFLESIKFKAGNVPAARVNQSPPVDLLEIMRMFGSSIPTYEERRAFYRILRSLQALTDDRKYTLFNTEERELILNLYRESNQRVAREYLGRSDGVLFYDSEAVRSPIYPGLSQERFALISRKMIQTLAGINSQLAEKISSSA